MQKFENVDVLAVLEQIMRQHTAFYQNDFDIDKSISIGTPPAIRPWIRPCFGCPGPLGHTVFGSVTFS